ncbi:hypothetical protein H9Q73_010429 [Fusarium xylarioides]|nr:hypothetical protein H9Q73_010429 [Fusarium xylarioides]
MLITAPNLASNDFIRYPGVRCDITFHPIVTSWAKNPDWDEFYSTGQEIQSYIQKVVDLYDLCKYFVLSHRVTGATWDDECGVWDVEIERIF